MHAFSEILLAPPAVEVLRTEEPRSAWQRRPLPVRPPMRSSSATRIESSIRRWRHRLRLHEAKGLRVALLRPHARDLVERIMEPLPLARNFSFGSRLQASLRLPYGPEPVGGPSCEGTASESWRRTANSGSETQLTASTCPGGNRLGDGGGIARTGGDPQHDV
jgi:hypothetical protein